MGLATTSISTSKARRFWALLLCVLWIAGFEIGPGMHVAFHDAFGHHHHGATAAHAQAAADDHHPHAAEHDGHHDEVEHHDHVEEHDHAHGHHDEFLADDEHWDDALADDELLAAFADDDAVDHWEDDAFFDEDVHEHDHEAHEEHAPADALDVPPDPRDLLASVSDESLACPEQAGHGAHALAHRGVVAFPSVSPWPPIAVAPWASVLHGQVYSKSIEDRTPRSVRARGPPALV